MIAAALRLGFRPLLLAPLLLVAACKGEPQAEQAPPPEVLTVVVQPQPVTVLDELPGRVVAWRTADIRPQVGGIVQQRLFEQGALVHAGQPLFQISPAPFRADADTARATLAKAMAAHVRAATQADRLKPLVAADAISRQTYDDALATRAQTAAEVAEARATLRRRQLDLGFSRVTAPITGRIGAANVTEGALVGTADANPLATVQQIDRVYVDSRQPAERYAALRAAGPAAGLVQIVTASGKVHPMPGRILFSGLAVDPATGDVLVRIAVDNPGEQLLPGMYVRVRLPSARLPAAITVPQQAVARDAAGAAQVSIVDQQGRVQVRPVIAGAVVDGRYVIQSGLRPGDRVIVAGQDRVQPGAAVTARPWRGRDGPA